MTTVIAAVDSTDSARAVVGGAAWLASFLDADTDYMVSTADDATSLEAAIVSAAAAEKDTTDDNPRPAVRKVDIALETALPGELGLVRVAGMVLALAALPDGRDHPALRACHLATRSHKPMLFVRPGAGILDAQGPKRVLVPLDGSTPSSRATAPFVSRLAEHGSEVVLVHVFDEETVPHYFDQYHHAHEVWRKEFLTRHSAGSRNRLSLRSGLAPATILDSALVESSELLIMSCSGNMAPERNRTVREVLAQTTVPVLLVPSSREDGESGDP